MARLSRPVSAGVSGSRAPCGSVWVRVSLTRSPILVRFFSKRYIAGELTLAQRAHGESLYFSLCYKVKELLALLPEPTNDPDGDGVGRELSVGDITAMVMYNAGQEIPHSVQ